MHLSAPHLSHVPLSPQSSVTCTSQPLTCHTHLSAPHLSHAPLTSVPCTSHLCPMHLSPLSHTPLTSVTCTTHLCHTHHSPLSHAPLTSVTCITHLCPMHHSPLSHAPLTSATCTTAPSRSPPLQTPDDNADDDAAADGGPVGTDGRRAGDKLRRDTADDQSVCIARPDDLSVCIARPDDLSVCIARPDGACARSVDLHFSSAARCLPSGCTHCNDSGAARIDLVKVSRSVKCLLWRRQSQLAVARFPYYPA